MAKRKQTKVVALYPKGPPPRNMRLANSPTPAPDNVVHAFGGPMPHDRFFDRMTDVVAARMEGGRLQLTIVVGGMIPDRYFDSLSYFVEDQGTGASAYVLFDRVIARNANEICIETTPVRWASPEQERNLSLATIVRLQAQSGVNVWSICKELFPLLEAYA